MMIVIIVKLYSYYCQIIVIALGHFSPQSTQILLIAPYIHFVHNILCCRGALGRRQALSLSNTYMRLQPEDITRIAASVSAFEGKMLRQSVAQSDQHTIKLS